MITKKIQKKSILFFVTEDWYFWTHRRDLALAAKEKGYEITLVTRVHEHHQRINELGINVIPIDIKRSSLNPFIELSTFINLLRVFQEQKPDLVHNVALKPAIYGTWAGKISGVQGIVNAFGGLGHLFSAEDWKLGFIKKLVAWIMRVTFWGGNIRIILQNSNDLKEILERKIVPEKKTRLIRGAGVNLELFTHSKDFNSPPIVLYAGRMLWSKGVGDLVEAAKFIKNQKIDCRFVLVGRPDPENPESISKEKILSWEEKGIIEYWGFQEDMPKVISKSAIVVLPTCYGEGVPKILIEAAAVGRPIIATEVPGCKEIVIEGKNGYLIPCHDKEKLAAALSKLLKNQDLREQMGTNGRKLAEEEFSNDLVNQAVLELYSELENSN